MRKEIVILAGVLFGLTSFSQDEVSVQFPDTPISVQGVSSMPGTHSLSVVENPDLSSQNHKVLEATFYVKFSIDDNGLHKIGDALDNLEIEFTLTENFTTAPSTSDVVGITLDANQAAAVYKVDFSTELQDETFSSFDIVAISVNTPVISSTYVSNETDLIAYVNDHLLLTGWYEVKYGVDVRTPEPGLLPCEPLAMTPKNTTGVLTSRIQTFDWSSTEGHDFPNYEFQLLKLENQDLDPDNYITTVDWSKALTLETYSSSTDLTLTLAQGSGYYIWRVRPIGNFFEGGIADSRNWGQWSGASLPNGYTIDLTDPITYTSIPSALLLEDPDDELNWIYSRVFTEDGNVSEGMTYANNLLQPVQSQAYSSSTGQVITSQTLYDFVGRPAMSTLPVPTTSLLDGYKEEFALNTSGELYSADDFDADGNIHNPGTFDQTTSPFSYYSDANPDVMIPDAEGYPFTRTIFMNDGSGRPIEQSGVGKVHAIGQITNGETRTTRVYYATPSDDELIAIFGDEAPLAENVLKTSTIDPNGTVSIVYTTMEGKTIATAMTHKSANNLEDIDASETAQLDINANYVTVVNTLDQNMFISSKIIVLNELTNVDLTYQMDCSTLANSCGTPDCDYRIKFRIINEVTGEYFESNSLQVTCGGLMDFTDLTWPAGVSYLITGGNEVCSLSLPEGYWKVQKVVWSALDPSGINANGPMAKLEPLMRLVSDWMNDVTNDSEYDAFMIMLNDFNDDLAAAHVSASGSCTPDYNDIASCYQMHPDFVAIRTTYGLDTDYVFDPAYSLSLPVDGGTGNQMISFQAGCCNNIEVDVPELEAHEVCGPIDDLLTSGNLTENDVVFSQIFKEFFDELVEDGVFASTDMNSEWLEATPGYGDLVETSPGSEVYTSDFDLMIFHMLTDQYYTGKAYNQSTTTTPDWVTFESKDDTSPISVYPIPSGADPEVYGPYYTCNELYDCFYATMRAYYEMYALKGQSFNIYDLVNEDQDPGGTGDPAGTHYDDPENADAEGGFLDWLINNIISAKMKKFSDELAGEDGSGNDPLFAYQLNIPSLFLDCTGKKIAAIVSPDIDEEVNYEIYLDDNYTGTPESLILAVDENGDVIDNPEQMMYPYITKPLWAFKYYEYLPGFEISESATDCDAASILDYTGHPLEDLVKPVPTVELQNCYHSFDAVNFCSTNPCEFGHHTWNSSEREYFYDLIKYTEEDEEFELTNTSSPLDCPTQTELDDMKQAEFDKAYQACNDRADKFKAGIEFMFIENCYEIVPCLDGTSTNQVSESDIQTLTDNTVAACSLYVDAIILECEDGYIPNCTINTCCFWNGAGFGETNEPVINLFDPNNNTKERLYFVQYGNFIPAMAPEDSKCNTPPDLPEWYDNPPIDPGCPEEVLTPVIIE